MIHIKDLIGKQFGKLIIVSEAGHAPRQPCGSLVRMVYCICLCGKQLSVRLKLLKNGNTKSCGCLFSERLSKRNRTHGQAGKGKHRTRIYNIWGNMIARCNNKNNIGWKYYGGRGIKVCDRWLNSFENFYEDMGDRPDGLTLGRIKNERGYFKENCRWETLKQQSNNKRSNVRLEHDGKSQTIAQWAREYGLNQHTLANRIRRGWNTEKALDTPVQRLVKQNTQVLNNRN